MEPFEIAIGQLFPHEGGVSTDRSDPAAAEVKPGQAHTNLGISLAAVHALDKGADQHLKDWLLSKFDIDHDGDIDALDVPGWKTDSAKEFYRLCYWDPAGCSKLPWPVSNLVFDLAVNAGKVEAIMVLQRALGVPVDGICGPNTVAAAWRQKNDAGRVFLDFTAHKLDFYRKNPPASVEANFLGWAKRSIDVLIFSLQEA